MPDTTLNPDTLAEHQFRPGFERCTCGQKIPTTLHSKYYVDFPDYQAMARHQMEALAVALPEVTSVEELHQLPSGSIVRASGGSAWKKFGSGWGAWFKAGDSLDYEASIVALPARVLYRPEVKP